MSLALVFSSNRSANTYLFFSYSVEKDFESLNQLSHFLKGSAATLGLWRIRDGCEKIQNLSAGRHLHNPRDEAADNKAFEEITSLVNETVIESGTCETLLRKFYEGSN